MDVGRIFAALLVVSLVYLIPAFIGCGLILAFSSKKLKLNVYDGIMFLIPPPLWVTLIYIHDGHRSLSNAVVEPFLLGLVATCIFLVRNLVLSENQNIDARVAAGTMVVITVLFWISFPGLPE